MPRLSPPKIVFLVAWLLILSTSCVKNIENALNIPPPPTDTTDNGTPAVTDIGTPVGNPVSKTIDASGGSLTSADGKVELDFPAGSLAASTTITIQPVTNTTPNGIGLSYHFTPDGSTFSKPVTLKFHYADSDINGTIPFLLYIAFQDANRQWRADVKNRDVDTVAKTVSLGITHFSIWSLGAELVMFPDPKEVYENEHSTTIIFKSKPVVTSGSSSDPDDLPPLPVAEQIDGTVTAWKVNGIIGGNPTDGTIGGVGVSGDYTAPAEIDEKRTVQVSAELNYTISYFNKGQLVSSANKFIIFANITLLPSEYDFTVKLAYRGAPVNGLLYEATAYFDLTIKKYADPGGGSTLIVLGSNFKNPAPTCSPTPPTITYPGGGSYTCVPGTIGVLYMTDGDVTLGRYNDDSAFLFLAHTGALGWGAKTVDRYGTPGEVPQTPTLGFINTMVVALKNETQVYYDPSDPTYPSVTITPR